MKAAAYSRTGPPEVLEYLDVPDPVCQPNGLLVRVEAVSIEGGDTLNRLGGAMTSDPHIVGYQCAGTVIEAGANVDASMAAVGDRVVCTMPSGSHAELVAVTARSVWKVAEGTDLGAELATPRARTMVADLLDDVAAGRLEVVVDRTYPLAEAAAAHAYLESRQAVGRVVLIP